jgi:hypothetical protein
VAMPTPYVDEAAWRERQRRLVAIERAANPSEGSTFEEWVRAHPRRGTRGVRSHGRRRPRAARPFSGPSVLGDPRAWAVMERTSRLQGLEEQYRLAEADASYFAGKANLSVNDADVHFYNESKDSAAERAARLRRLIERLRREG